jgi:hypothetical protein
MSKPEYPTKEGIWSRGRRQEKSYEGFQLGMPYKNAVENFRKASEGRNDFDPAVLFVWGTMQAKAVLGILKAVEETFGADGQEIVRKAINKVGYEAALELFADCTFSEEMTKIELISFFVTAINVILYASLERPKISSEASCEFDILWCPHQDIYTAFDCRVQRYFVEGMFDGFKARRLGRVTAAVEKLIPHGAECCHFRVDCISEAEGKNPWHAYSEELGRRALRKKQDEKQETDISKV